MPWYKLAKPSGWDFHTGQTINYREALGSVVTCPDYAATATCGAGIHLSQDPNACFTGAALPCSAYLLEPLTGLVPIDATKSKAQQVRVLEEIHDLDTLLGWEYRGLLQFLAEVPQLPWLRPDGQPDPAWKLVLQPTLRAAWGAAWDAARRGTRGAAWVAAWSAVREVRATAHPAVLAAYTAAARSVALSAALDAPIDALSDAACDMADAASGAVVGATMRFLCPAFQVSEAYKSYLARRLAVWRKGYGLLCDLQGVFYVYGIGEKD